MTYVKDRIIHDADAHTMEPPEWLDNFATKEVREYARSNFFESEESPILARSTIVETFNKTQSFAPPRNTRS